MWDPKVINQYLIFQDFYKYPNVNKQKKIVGWKIVLVIIIIETPGFD